MTNTVSGTLPSKPQRPDTSGRFGSRGEDLSDHSCYACGQKKLLWESWCVAYPDAFYAGTIVARLEFRCMGCNMRYEMKKVEPLW